MPALQRFRREHGTIMERLAVLDRIGVASAEGRGKLEELEGVILAHLREEEEILYPMLWEIANEDKKLRHELEQLHEALEGFSMAAAEYFQQLNHAPAEAGVMESAYQAFKQGLLRRVEWEERVLPRLMERGESRS